MYLLYGISVVYHVTNEHKQICDPEFSSPYRSPFDTSQIVIWGSIPSADSLEVLHVPWIQAVLNPSCAKALWRSCLLPHEQLLQEVSLFPYHFTMSMDTAKFFNSSRQNKNKQENCFKDELISLFLEKEIIFS